MSLQSNRWPCVTIKYYEACPFSISLNHMLMASWSPKMELLIQAFSLLICLLAYVEEVLFLTFCPSVEACLTWYVNKKYIPLYLKDSTTWQFFYFSSTFRVLTTTYYYETSVTLPATADPHNVLLNNWPNESQGIIDGRAVGFRKISLKKQPMRCIPGKGDGLSPNTSCAS
jgi:hypothetical protein